jgi:hypothetical protein
MTTARTPTRFQKPSFIPHHAASDGSQKTPLFHASKTAAHPILDADGIKAARAVVEGIHGEDVHAPFLSICFSPILLGKVLDFFPKRAQNRAFCS